MSLYKLEEWQGGSGLWYCEHTSSFPKNIQKWVVPARLLGMPADQFLKWLIENYHPDVINHNDDYSYVGWAWKDQSSMRKFKNYINAEARKKNFMI